MCIRFFLCVHLHHNHVVQPHISSPSSRISSPTFTSFVLTRGLYPAFGCKNREHGAVGSRLTGAGWGGCAVSLVASENIPSFLEAIRKKYYHAFEDKVCGCG